MPMHAQGRWARACRHPQRSSSHLSRISSAVCISTEVELSDVVSVSLRLHVKPVLGLQERKDA